MAERWTEVAVTRDTDGLVRVAPVAVPASPAEVPDAIFHASLPVAGGVLTVDVRHPQEAPTALLADPHLAQAWLRAVYGPAVAAQLVKYADDPDYNAQWRDFAERDYLSALVGRLGEEFWLHRWWPADWAGLPPLDEDLLEVEISGLASLAEPLFAETEPIRHLLAPHGLLVATQVSRLLELAPDDVSGAELRVFAAALRAVVDLVSDEAPGYAECQALTADPRLAALEQEPVTARVAGAPWLRAMADRVKLLTESARDRMAAQLSNLAYVGTRGGEIPLADEPFTFRGVDETLVPPRVVSMREPFANLAYRKVGDGPTLALEVRVPAASHYDDTRGDVLYARAYDASNVPIEFPLQFVRDSADAAGAFVATRRLYVEPAGDLEVDVYHRDFIGRPRLTPNATNRASAERLARVVFIQDREGLPSDDLSLTEQAMRVAEQD